MRYRRALFSLMILAALSAPPSVAAFDWQAIGPEGGAIRAFAQAVSDPNRIYIRTDFGVLRSDDHGDSWTATTNEPYAPVAVYP